MEKEITLTPVADIVAMTKSFPEQKVQGPLVYEQVIPNASEKADASYGRPDPAHVD